jgi:hypothetical protein
MRQEAEMEILDTLDGWLDVHVKIGKERRGPRQSMA